MKRKYVPPQNITKQEFHHVAHTGTSSEICQAVVDITHSYQDYRWIRERLETMLSHEDIDVRKVTITCVGHLGRLYDESNIHELVQLLAPLESEVELEGYVEDAVDELNTYYANRKRR